MKIRAKKIWPRQRHSHEPSNYIATLKPPPIGQYIISKENMIGGAFLNLLERDKHLVLPYRGLIGIHRG